MQKKTPREEEKEKETAGEEGKTEELREEEAEEVFQGFWTKIFFRAFEGTEPYWKKSTPRYECNGFII